MLGHNTPSPRQYISYRTEYDPEVGSHGGCILYIRRAMPHVSIHLSIPEHLKSILEVVAVQIDLRKNIQYTLSIYTRKR